MDDHNGWPDFWRYSIGVNVIPADTANKKTNTEWIPWQNKLIPKELHDYWKHNHKFDNGLAVVLGRAWHKDPSLYFWGMDPDNQKAIDIICTRNGEHTSLQELSKIFIVEQHEDDPTRSHIYGYSRKPYPKISANGICEVKSQGEHGIMFCTPSLHKNGHHYQITGTMEPTINEELLQHVIRINNVSVKGFSGRIPVK